MQAIRGKATWLRRLRRDTSGNTLAMMAIALVPISALAGSGVDAARMYVVKVRLQQACDAGVLAGRKFMLDSADTTLDANASAKATEFFNNNFKNGWMRTSGASFMPVKTADKQVSGTASATVPMTVMKMFNMPDETISVSCQARLEIPNLDVMFVLDTTGSMSETNPGDATNRITGLRNAVGSFYDTLEASKTASSRIRYGFVPYSSTVNVGMLLKRDWMVDNWTYQSRIGGTSYTQVSKSTAGAWLTQNGPWVYQSGTVETIKTNGLPENCVAPANTAKTTNDYTAYSDNGDGWEIRYLTQTIKGSNYSTAIAGGICTITETRYIDYIQKRWEKRKPNPDAGTVTETTNTIYPWDYRAVTYDVSALKGNGGGDLVTGGSISPFIDGGGTNNDFKKRKIDYKAANACIEERATVRATDYSTIPTDAYDMDVDTVPDPARPETQWRPWVADLVYARSYGSNAYTNPSVVTTSWPANRTATVTTTNGYINLVNKPNDFAACVSPARKLDTITKTQLTNYLNALTIKGRTYHDVGFVWGLRLLSKEGLFASENTTAPNGGPIDRNIIFMTDGATETNFGDYDAYGLAALDRRRTDISRLPAGDAETTGLVEKRLTALCQVARRKNITVWVIAFGTTLTPLLENCATTKGHAYQANNTAELNSAFAKISANIARLRVSQ